MGNPVRLSILVLNIIIISFLLASPLSLAAAYKGEKFNYKTESIPTPPPCIAPPPRIILHGGPYLGATLGYDSYKISEEVSINRPGTALSAENNPTIDATGLVGGLVAGYGQYSKDTVYLGLEAFVNLSDAYQSYYNNLRDAANSITYNSIVHAILSYGISFIPGIKLSDSSLVYLRLGYSVARFKAQETEYLNALTNYTHTNTSNWSGGFAYGIGFEEAMYGNFSLRGDFIHTDYASFNATTGNEFSPADNQFMLGLLYHFT